MQTCLICHQVNAYEQPYCAVIYHKECLQQWLKKEPICPHCHTYLYMSKTNKLYLMQIVFDLLLVFNTFTSYLLDPTKKLWTLLLTVLCFFRRDTVDTYTLFQKFLDT